MQMKYTWFTLIEDDNEYKIISNSKDEPVVMGYIDTDRKGRHVFIPMQYPALEADKEFMWYPDCLQDVVDILQLLDSERI